MASASWSVTSVLELTFASAAICSISALSGSLERMRRWADGDVADISLKLHEPRLGFWHMTIPGSGPAKAASADSWGQKTISCQVRPEVLPYGALCWGSLLRARPRCHGA